LVEGRLVPDKETGGPRVYQKNDGTSGAAFEISASTVRFLSAKGEVEGEATAGETAPHGEDTGDIPF
jgi:single-strand DNA-binding protein